MRTKIAAGILTNSRIVYPELSIIEHSILMRIAQTLKTVADL